MFTEKKYYVKGHYWNVNSFVAICNFAGGPENRRMSKVFFIL